MEYQSWKNFLCFQPDIASNKTLCSNFKCLVFVNSTTKSFTYVTSFKTLNSISVQLLLLLRSFTCKGIELRAREKGWIEDAEFHFEGIWATGEKIYVYWMNPVQAVLTTSAPLCGPLRLDQLKRFTQNFSSRKNCLALQQSICFAGTTLGSTGFMAVFSLCQSL